MKDLVHHLNHVQKKVVASSRKSSPQENKNPKESPQNPKKKIYQNR